MKIIKQSAELLFPLDEKEVLKRLELCGRVCYKSEHRITDDSAEKFIQNIINRGHEAVLEHYSFSVRFICDRGISHQIVRHRIASYCQESTRYCNYSKDNFGSEITVIEPLLHTKGERYDIWKHACEQAEIAYFKLLDTGCTPEKARAVLPHSLKTELIMTANIREWRHFLKTRCSFDAHPEMVALACSLLETCKILYPILFSDI